MVLGSFEKVDRVWKLLVTRLVLGCIVAVNKWGGLNGLHIEISFLLVIIPVWVGGVFRAAAPHARTW